MFIILNTGDGFSVKLLKFKVKYPSSLVLAMVFL